MDRISKSLALILILIVAISSLSLSMIKSAHATEMLSVEWQHYLPGVSGTSVIQTSDGGFLALGLNASTYLVSGGYETYETFFSTVAVKTDSLGNVIWAKTYSFGQNTDTELNQAVQTDDGYILAGGTSLIKIDLQGNIIWQKNLSQTEGISTFTPTSDGGFVIGVSLSTESPSPPEFGVVKLDSEGNTQWQIGTNVTSGIDFSRIFWGTVTSIFQTSDQGYVIVTTDFTHAYLSTPIQMFKLDSNGNLQWNQTYSWHTVSSQSSIYTMYAKSSIPLTDGYLIVGGVNMAGEPETGLILKTDLNGNLIWNKTYAYSDMPSTINSVSLSNNGSLMFVGYADKNVGTATYGSYTWVAQVDSLGNVQGQLAIDMGNHLSNPASIIQATDGGHVFVGVWNETTGFINQQFWLVKISNTGTSTQTPSPTPGIPEFPTWIILPLFAAVLLSTMFIRKRKPRISSFFFIDF